MWKIRKASHIKLGKSNSFLGVLFNIVLEDLYKWFGKQNINYILIRNEKTEYSNLKKR